MAVAVRTVGPTFGADPPRPLDVAPGSVGYGATSDGQRFLVGVPIKQREPIRVLVGWLPPGM
jgi:hypothetical protein